MNDPPLKPRDLADVSPRLIWAEDGSPRSGPFNDVYFSADGGLAESRAVFLQGCDLPRAWADRASFTVAELGFGTGLNVVALLDLWRRERPPGGHLHIVSVEAFPITRAEAERALSAWPQVSAAASDLLRAWPAATPGFHRIDLDSADVTFDLLIGDAATMLNQWSGRADAWFLDGFSPAVNPEMWSDAVLDAVAARSAADARLATFSVASAVRRGLSNRGFQVDKRPGHGRKRERLEARRDGAAELVRPSISVAVIGGGIAGASVCRALADLGARPVLIEAVGAGAGASGFPAALVTPRLDVGDSIIAGLHAQALERARQLYDAIPGAVTAHGVFRLATTQRDASRFAKIAGQPLWSEGEMVVIDADITSSTIGETLDQSGLRMAGAVTVRPELVLQTWLGGVTIEVERAHRLEPTDDGWRIIDVGGTVLAEIDQVVIASGADAARLWPDAPLSPVRGQAEWASGLAAPAAVWGGYVAPTGQGLMYGATHDRGDTDDRVRPADRARNLAAVRARLPLLADRLEAASTVSRAAVRATTPDRLPLCGPAGDRPGVWILGGLGSRGFCLAPLLGEHLAATILKRPSPLPAAFAHRLRPDRFAQSNARASSGSMIGTPSRIG